MTLIHRKSAITPAPAVPKIGLVEAPRQLRGRSNAGKIITDQ